jgi:uncharacterized membrane protein YphA (DoxX/SURF4 family)
MGWLFIGGGLILAIAGFFISRKFDPPVRDQAVFRPAGPPLAGLLAFLGVLLLVFGLCCIMVGVMVTFF